MAYENMTLIQMQARLGEVLEIIADIKGQIEKAQSHYAATGEYASRNWYSKAQTALRMYGREQQMLQIEMGKRRREEKRRAHEALVETRDNIFYHLLRDGLEIVEPASDTPGVHEWMLKVKEAIGA